MITILGFLHKFTSFLVVVVQMCVNVCVLHQRREQWCKFVLFNPRFFQFEIKCLNDMLNSSQKRSAIHITKVLFDLNGNCKKNAGNIDSEKLQLHQVLLYDFNNRKLPLTLYWGMPHRLYILDMIKSWSCNPKTLDVGKSSPRFGIGLLGCTLTWFRYFSLSVVPVLCVPAWIVFSHSVSSLYCWTNSLNENLPPLPPKSSDSHERSLSVDCEHTKEKRVKIDETNDTITWCWFEQYLLDQPNTCTMRVQYYHGLLTCYCARTP